MAEAEAQHERISRREPAQPAAAGPTAAAAANPMLAQQQTIGNQAVQRQIRTGTVPPGVILGQQGTLGNQAIQRLLHTRALQARLTVTAPADQYEQEADRVAAQVTAAPPPSPAPAVQRDHEAEPVQRTPLAAGIAPLVQRDATGAAASVDGGLEAAIQGKRGGGQPLDDSVRGAMEHSFGADFSGVRVHTDGAADTLNQAVSARAFTTGQDIFFRSGEYAPDSSGGQQLLAHELTHVVQQNGGGVQRTPEPPGPVPAASVPGARPAPDAGPIVQRHAAAPTVVAGPWLPARRTAGRLRPQSPAHRGSPGPRRRGREVGRRPLPPGRAR